MGRAARIERAIEAALAVRLARSALGDDPAACPLRRAERLIVADIGPSVPKRRAAALLGISVAALQRWISVGRLPSVRRPGAREEIDTAALLDVLAEVRRLREEGNAGARPVARAFARLAARGRPLARLRPNQPPRELRRSFLSTAPRDRLREAADVSAAATTLARYGARARAGGGNG